MRFAFPLALIVALAVPDRAEACVCGEPGFGEVRACFESKEATAIFVGKALDGGDSTTLRCPAYFAA